MADNPALDTPNTDQDASAPDAEANAPTPVNDEAPQADQAEKVEQSVSLEDVGPARKKITIEVPESRIQEKLTENLNDLQEQAVLPGFRRGRAPKRLIEKRFGEDIREEVKQRIVNESMEQAVEENNLRILGEADMSQIEDMKLPESGPMTITVEVEVAPEIELPDLSDIVIEKPASEVTEEQITAEIERFREMQGKAEKVEGPTEEKDYLTADVTIKDKDGQVVETHEATGVYVPGESRKFKGVVAGILVEDLGRHVMDKRIGDTVTVEATGPSQHEKEELRAQPLTIDIAIKEIERFVFAPLEQLLEQAGYESEEELREVVKPHLESRAQQQQQTKMHEQVKEALLDRVEMDLPGGVTADQTERTLNRKQMEMLQQGASQQDIDEALAELRASSEEEAKRELKFYFIVDKIAEAKDVEVSEQELNGQITQMAIQQNRRPEKMRQELARSGRLQSMYMQLRESKAIDAILEEVQVKEVAAADAEKTDGEAETSGDDKATA